MYCKHGTLQVKCDTCRGEVRYCGHRMPRSKCIQCNRTQSALPGSTTRGSASLGEPFLTITPVRLRRKEKPFNRKELALQKHQGRRFEFDDGRSSAVTEPESEFPEAPKESVSKKDIAQFFFDAMAKEGLPVFLSGGAALGWQGGHRPISDLDFRISAEDLEAGSFAKGRGRSVFDFINRVVLPNLRSKFSVKRAQANEFFPVGKDAITIGSENWFGVEISLSLVPWRPKSLVRLRRADAPAVDALSMSELQCDKFKAMITRTKRGQDSIKKVAQDLFDFLDATFLLEQQATINETISMEQHLEEVISGRLEEYRVANLEGMQLHHLHDEALRELMRARAVLTAQAHYRAAWRRDQDKGPIRIQLKTQRTDEIQVRIKLRSDDKIQGGARSKRFAELLPYNPEVESLLGELCQIPLKASSKSALRPWMASWNQGPFYGPKKTGKGRASLMGDSRQGAADVEELLDLCPEGFLSERVPSGISELSLQMLQVLYLSGGFRPLKNSKMSVQTLESTGLAQNQFSKAFAELKALGLVEGKPDGLHLTEVGTKLLNLEALDREPASALHAFWGKCLPAIREVIRTRVLEATSQYPNIHKHIFHHKRATELAGYANS